MTDELRTEDGRLELLSRLELSNRLDSFLLMEPLPGLATSDKRESLIQKLLDSYFRVYRKRLLSKARGAPGTQDLRAFQTVVDLFKGGDHDEAVWLAFLCTHLGEDVPDSVEQFYTRFGTGRWTWRTIKEDTQGLRDWLHTNEEKLALLRFGNHRKRETHKPGHKYGTPAVVASFCRWAERRSPNGSPYEALLSVTKGSTSPEGAFDKLFEDLKVVRFGRTAKFDFLAVLGNLGILPVSPGHVYLKGATGPRRGALLMVAGRAKGKLTSQVEETIGRLQKHLAVPLEVLEDALCNWQKQRVVRTNELFRVKTLTNTG